MEIKKKLYLQFITNILTNKKVLNVIILKNILKK